MRTNYKLKISTLFAVLLFAASAFAQDEIRAVTTWQVQKYDVDVTLPAGERDRATACRATVTLKNVSGKAATSLTLRIATNAEVTSLKINDATNEFRASEEKVSPSLSLNRQVARIPSVAAGATITATLEYKFTQKDNSGSASFSPLGSQLLPSSYWYPTPNSWFFGRGPDMAPVRLKVNGAPKTIVSAGTDAAGVFDSKLSGQPFFVSGDWDVINSNGVSVYAPKGSADAQKLAGELAAIFTSARDFAATYLGTAPQTPLKIVAVHRGAGFSSNGVVLIDDGVFRRKSIDSLTAMNIAEAATKLWIGGSIAVGGEGYGIIREGLARYIATEFIESKYGKDAVDIERLRQRNAYAAIARRDGAMMRISPLDDLYYSSVANKGAMAWRLIAKRVGKTEFTRIITDNAKDGSLDMTELRTALSANSDLTDYLFDQITNMNLMIGLPQVAGGDVKFAIRNTGIVDATVNVRLSLAGGQMMEAPTTVKAASFGEITFKTTAKVDRVEIDTDKLYPQIDYSDDIKPTETSDSDPLLAVKRSFDIKKYDQAESAARLVLRSMPRFDDVRVLLGRSLLGLNRFAEAEKEFNTVLAEPLPTARSIVWATVGLAEAAAGQGRNDVALTLANSVIASDTDVGASFAARTLRNKLGATTSVDASIKTFFADFDRAAQANRKAELDALFLSGEATKFAGGISGSTESWQSQVRQVDRVGQDTLLVEVGLNIRMLTKEAESGMAIYRLARVGNAWRIAGVEMFEVR
ncbi:MAG TPA: hypothetical protein PKA82_11185 [Pyrinomonadaceae bacterium]|nr:hypothetical protein [Pyrinomonadaceae bacterium]